MITLIPLMFMFFFFNDTATTEIYTLSLHDALPISGVVAYALAMMEIARGCASTAVTMSVTDRKSTRLNSSHSSISYAVFCLKKKKKDHEHTSLPRISTRSLP